MKTIIIICCFCILNSLTAQINVSSSDFISGQDTVLVSSVADFQNINYLNGGANQTWDFSNVLVDNQRIDTFSNMSTAGFIYLFAFDNFISPDYQASYYKKASLSAIPTGGLPLAIENPISFEKVSSTKLERVGFGLDFNGVPFPVRADTIDVVFELPMTYQDNWVSNSYLLFDLNPAFNAKFKRHQNRVSEVDGFGTVITPFGTFECIRVKSSLNYIDSIYFDVFGTGNASWFGVPSQPEVQYRWIAKNQKIPVFTVDVTNTLGVEAVTKVEFRDELDVTSVKEINSINFSVYPNPAHNYIKVSSPEGIDNIKVTSASGEIIFNSEALINTHQIDCSTWSRGIYIVTVDSSEKISTKKIVLH